MPDPAAADLALLVARFKTGQHDSWSAADITALGRQLVDRHALLDAQEVLRQGLERWPDDVAIRRLLGLACSRAEAPEQAIELLTPLVAAGHRDGETLGLLAAAHKKLGLLAGDEKHLREALALYGDVFAREEAFWHGINVATVATLLGDRDRARSTADAVLAVCREHLAHPDAHDDYWLLATVGEAHVNRGDLAAAAEWFARARRAAGSRYGMLDSTRRQLRPLIARLGAEPALVDEWLSMPRAVIFAGHMLDRPGRPSPRFPAGQVAAVDAAIRAWLAGRDAGFGFSSAACGGDILFQEALAARGAERTVVLPFPEEVFRKTSVERDGAEGWSGRFDPVVAGATRVVRASRTPLRHDGLSYDYANQLIVGLARARAAELGAALEALVVWDGQPGDGGGGTAALVARCRRLGIPVHVIDPRPEATTAAVAQPADEAATPGIAGVETPFGAVLFADAKGFSSLPDAEVPLFAERFLGKIGAVVKRYGPERIVVRETWGDGLFFAFPRLLDAALFALDVSELVNGTDWQQEGFSFPLRLRTALHHGPMYPTIDPITERPGVSGAHIAQAARLEPKTPPGQVYATEAFAARAALENHAAFRCTFVRQLDFDKRYGTFPTYVISRGTPLSGGR